MPAPTIRAPAKAFPMVAGTRFFMMTSGAVAGAPAARPEDRRKMFVIECSKPIPTNMEMGNHIPTIFPERPLAMVLSQMAAHSSQLHITPFTNVCPKLDEHLDSTASMAMLAAPPVSRPVYWATARSVRHPKRFPKKLRPQLRRRLFMVTCPSKAPMAMMAALPVKSCAPVCSTSSRFTGNKAAKSRFRTVGLAVMLPPTTKESKPAIPTKQPPM
mmetsp:Transcript_136004/g.322257  ORF Transcript_136004/g.322257 Transcript_136004/m.322257 type:complete len:215 (+) Transcript_136004:192-836(+)